MRQYKLRIALKLTVLIRQLKFDVAMDMFGGDEGGRIL